MKYMVTGVTSRILSKTHTALRRCFFCLVSENRPSVKGLLHQPAQFMGRGRIEFSPSANLGYKNSPGFFSTYAYLEARNSGATIRIGEGTWINNGFCAICEHTSIQIGARCMIGPNCTIYDSDFHGVRLQDRLTSDPSAAAAVHIADDVFIGANCTVLKGVRIGARAVIAAGSMITRDVPADTIAGGNPAKIIRPIIQ
jgi:maltose O-acetyltransferase